MYRLNCIFNNCHLWGLNTPHTHFSFSASDPCYSLFPPRYFPKLLTTYYILTVVVVVATLARYCAYACALVGFAGWGVRHRAKVAAFKEYLTKNVKAFLQEHVVTPVRVPSIRGTPVSFLYLWWISLHGEEIWIEGIFRRL